MADVGRDLGISKQVVFLAVHHARSRRVCDYIAGLIGVPAAEIWPRLGIKRRRRTAI